MQQATQDAVFRGVDYIYRGPLLGIALVLLASLLAIAAWYMLVAHPRDVKDRQEHRLHEADERAKDRAHVESLLKQKGLECAEDAQRDRELAKAQNEVIVTRIEGRVDRLDGKVEEVRISIRRVADSLKIPILVLFLLLSLGSGLVLGYRVVAGRERCDPPCPEGQKCVRGACKDKDVLTNKPTSFALDSFELALQEPIDPWQDWGG